MPTTPPLPAPQPSFPRRLGRLCTALLVLWLIMRLTPALVDAIPPAREYADILEETGIIPGALYYTDVPQTVDAEFNNRDAIRYFVRKKSNSNSR